MLLETIEETESILETGTTHALETGEVVDSLKKAAENISPNKFKSFFEANYPKIIDFGLKVVLAIVVYFIVSKLIQYARKLLKKWLGISAVNEGVVHFLDLLVNIILHFILISNIVIYFGVKETSVAALLGTGGLTLGLALQGSLANFAGGILLLVLHPFKVGDYIIENTDKNEGTVLRIELFYTTLVTVDNKMITIPNGMLSNSSIVNVTAQDKRRLDIRIGIPYSADLQLAKHVILDILMTNPKVLENEVIDVFVEELGMDAVILGCRAWAGMDDFWSCKYEITEAVKLNFDANHIEIAHNQLDVFVKEK
jgi:small conductance mechanosensitive channel